MPLTLTETAGHTFPAGQPITLAALRKGALPAISISGGVSTGDLADGAVTPAKAAPGAYWYGLAILTGSAYGLTLTPALTGLGNGVLVRFRVDTVNPAGGVTLNVNGLGAKAIVKNKGLTLAAGDLRLNAECAVSYDGTAGVWQLVSPLGNHPDHYGVSTGSANAYVLTNDGTTQQTFVSLAQAAGVPVRFRPNFTNTGAATLALDGLTAKGIVLWNNQAVPNGYIRTNQVLEVVYDATVDAFLIPNAAKDTVVAASVRNLVAGNTVGFEATKVTVSADEAVVKDTAGNAVLLSTVAVTVAITTLGAANGLDTGAEAGSTWYYVWLIWDGTSTAGLLSVSGSAPTMPAGYTHKGLVGVVRNDAGSNFVRFWQADRRVHQALTNVFTGKNPAASDTWEVLAGADLTAFRAAVPPIAKEFWGVAGTTLNTRYALLQVAAGKDDGTVDTGNVVGGTVVGMGGFAAGGTGELIASYSAGAGIWCPVRGGSANYNFQWKGYLNTGNWARVDVTGFLL